MRSQSRTPLEFEELFVETAPATEQFVGEGITAFFLVSDPDAYHFSRPFEDTTATPWRETQR